MIKQKTSNDCLTCCLATYLDIEYDKCPNPYKWAFAWQSGVILWLEGLGYKGHFENKRKPIKKGRYITIGKSPRSMHSHAVIYNDGVLEYDPSASNLGIDYVRMVLFIERA